VIDKRSRRLIGALLIIDGLLTAILGRPFVKLFRFGPPGSIYRRVMTWWSRRPGWLLRASGVAEAAAGVLVAGSAPLSIHELYRAIAGAYAKRETSWRNWLYADAHAAFDQGMVRYLAPDGDVLDLGCGTGANLARLRELGVPFGTYTGVDISEAMLRYGRRKAEAGGNVYFEQLNLETEPLPEGPFDLIVSTWTLEHLRYPTALVQKAYRHLHPGGHMLLLFEINTGFWWGRVVDRVLHFLSLRQITETIYFNFPGLHRIRTYRGPLGDLALIVLRKPITADHVPARRLGI
jgi:SAM-dependent methyltransferase